MLLEDGELHGASREKKFKWKNADSTNWINEENKHDPENDDNEEIESELEWRKQRHEREVFIQEQRKKLLESQNEIEIITSDSQILQIGKNILKSQENSQDLIKKDKVADLELSVLKHKSFRGSFLARGELSLQRLSELTKESKDVVVTGIPKNNRNFLFTSIDKDDGEELNENKKRVAEKGTPKVLKKMRLAEHSPSNPKSKKSLKML